MEGNGEWIKAKGIFPKESFKVKKLSTFDAYKIVFDGLTFKNTHQKSGKHKVYKNSDDDYKIYASDDWIHLIVGLKSGDLIRYRCWDQTKVSRKIIDNFYKSRR